MRKQARRLFYFKKTRGDGLDEAIDMNKTGWKKIKDSIEVYSKAELIELLANLHKVSEEARLFLGGRFDPSPEALQPYLRALKKAVSTDLIEGEEIDWASADKVIKNYWLASGNNKGIAELLITYVYEANEFTLEYGDIDEEYYESVEERFQKAVDHLLLMEGQGEEIASHVKVLKDIVDSTSDIGWGYHDALGDMFQNAFGGIK